MKSIDNILVENPSSCHTVSGTQIESVKADSTRLRTLIRQNRVTVHSDSRGVPAKSANKAQTTLRCRRRNGVFYAFTLCVTLALAASAADAAAAPLRAGLMKLCPPGGESFASAWQMACGMRRRKKRDADGGNNGTASAVPSTGQHEALQAVVGLAISDPEPLAKSRAGDVEAASVARRKRAAAAKTPDSQYYAYNSGENTESSHYEPFAPSHKNGAPAALVLDPAVPGVGLSLMGGKKPTASQMIPSEMADLLAELNGDSTKLDEGTAAEEPEFRAPSISEVMMVCCRYGCSLRDLLPYCSPFGDWDSYY